MTQYIDYTVRAFDFGQLVAYKPDPRDPAVYSGKPSRSYTGWGRIKGFYAASLFVDENHYFILDIADENNSYKHTYTIRESRLLQLNPIGGLSK